MILIIISVTTMGLALANLACCAWYAGLIIRTEPLIALTMLWLAVAWVARKAMWLAVEAMVSEREVPGRRAAGGAHVVCCICWDGTTDYMLLCSHRFHEACIVGWTRTGVRTCPLCRAKML